MVREQDPNRLLTQAKEGGAEAREELIRRFTPFILSVASRVTGRFIRLGEDDEASVGLMAYNEAIDSFDRSRNSSFLSFAEMVIKRRLIDYGRREARSRANVPFSALEEEGESVAESMAQVSASAEVELRLEKVDRQAEIKSYCAALAEYGITFADLVKGCPQHQDARERSQAAARVVAANPLLSRYLLDKKELPLKALEREVETSRKTLERHRKYIIAMALVMLGDFDYLQEYIGYRKRGEGR